MLLCDEIKQICNNLSNNKEVSRSIQNNAITKLKKQWIKIMTYSNFYNKRYETYSFNHISITNYGVSLDIFIVPPLTFDKLDNVKDMLEENLGCVVIFNHKRASPWINTKFIFNQNDKKEFEIVKQSSPYNIYLSNDYSGLPIFADLRKYPHILITGSTRSGKSKLSDCVLTNLIVNCNSNEVNLYLCQVAKNDLSLYEQVEHCMGFADNLVKVMKLLDYIVNVEIKKRNDMIKPYRQKAILDNISEYNSLKGNKNKLPMILVCFDEMSTIFDTTGDDKVFKQIKNKIKSYVQSIAQYGASLSVYLLSSLQRPTHELLPPFIKAQSNITISLKQANAKSSEVATDDVKLAIGLIQREFVYKLDKWDYGLVPIVNNKKIYEYIKPYIKPHKTIFDSLNTDSIGKDKIKTKSKQQIINENTKKIKDYVPYEPISNNVIVLDKTKLPNNTQKPIKGGRIKIDNR